MIIVQMRGFSFQSPLAQCRRSAQIQSWSVWGTKVVIITAVSVSYMMSGSNADIEHYSLTGESFSK